MTKELNRVTLVALVVLGIIALSVTFWSSFQSDSLLARPDNLRNVVDEQRIRRGAIYDRSGEERLAYSEVGSGGVVQRVYPYPEAASAVGYYSFNYGTAGIELAFDDHLSGDNLRDVWQEIWDNTLHLPQIGGDVRSTLDLAVQQAVSDAMGDKRGAVVVVHVPSGRVLAIVSRPGYDPNTLDADWNRLTRNRMMSPLLNRVTAGQYRPGGALQTVMLAAILASHADLNEAGGYILNSEVSPATDPVTVGDLTLTCLPGTPDGPLTLAESYAYGCPAPFVMAEALTPGYVWERLRVVGLLDAPVLAGFNPAASTTPPPFGENTSSDTLRETITGEGDLTVSPLHLLQIVAAVANRGNAVPLHLVDATRTPDQADWIRAEIPPYNPALLRADVADAVRLTMLQAAAQSPYVGLARRENLVLYGHSALSYGPQDVPYVWFLGFVDRTEGSDAQAIAVVVVVEHESDPGVAAMIAGEAFAAE